MPKASRKSTPQSPITEPREDYVWIRKSGHQQEDAAQIENVRNMLNNRGIVIPEENWIATTVSRRKVTKDKDFLRLISLVKTRKVRTVYIEHQKRWGTKNSPQLFRYIDTFRRFKSQLWDLRNNNDICEDSVIAELMAIIRMRQSTDELNDIAYQPLRTKLSNFKERGSWPSGPQPFGFGKRVFDADGKTVKWEWQPVTRNVGQLYYPNAKGKLRPAGPPTATNPLKKKGSGWITKLVPSHNEDWIESVVCVFEYFTTQINTFRGLSNRLNAEGRTIYGKPFTYAIVAEILKNPAYVGDTHYGKTISGELLCFDANGEVVPRQIPEAPVNANDDEEDDDIRIPSVKRPVEEQFVKRKTHKGLIDRAMWNRAQKKLKDMEFHPTNGVRNPAYYLKEVLKCGHCDKNMTGNTEGKGDKKCVAYYCSTYRSGKSLGQKVPCGAHRITHDDAEQLLMNKMREMNLEFEDVSSALAREGGANLMSKKSKQLLHTIGREIDLEVEGVDALAEYYEKNHKVNPKTLEAFSQAATDFYAATEQDRRRHARKLRDVAVKVEAECVARAKTDLEKLEQEFEVVSKNWGRADDDVQPILQKELNELKVRIAQLKPRTIAISDRLRALRDERSVFIAERAKLIADLPAMEAREKGEAIRRVFGTIKLFWKSTFRKKENNPKRPRKTNRKGRYRYELLKDKIEWDFADLALTGVM